ncbi:MAG: DinB family protein [Saprospiraceae bacterium]|nr:DinB family protein [Saprospiraceae bacterium]
MDKDAIIKLIEEKHHELINWMEVHGSDYWTYGPSGKWTSAQHVVHLVQSMKPLNTAMVIPKMVLKMRFGKANRPTRTYDQVVNRYHERLKEAEGIVSPFSRDMPEPTLEEMDKWLIQLTAEKDKLVKSIDKKWKEKDLDICLLPHPLLGKMLVREMLMWTAYHTEHHYKLIKERAEANK